ncbi:MAG: ATP-dependent RecD-like DNA helicase [Oscillospiraceae bacterium]|jgi:exodeoxyribonuclease V alpha subunit|nr:ATP-dependent RecD-like DNA helicase [Oscillospiraceae bacterium]
MSYQQDADYPLDELAGTVESITFRNDENGWSVLDLSCEDDLHTVVGILPDVQPGEQLLLRGRWDSHGTYGPQFRAELCEQVVPRTAAQMLKYLSAKTVKGIGPATARRLVELYGDKTFDILENHPELLAEVRGMSVEKAQLAHEDFKKQFALRTVMIALEQIGMTSAECTKAYKVFGVHAPSKVASNPYALCELGIAFARAEQISGQLPERPAPALRLRAALVHTLRRAQYSDGHTCLPQAELLRLCCEMIQADWEDVQSTLADMVTDNTLRRETWDETDYIFMPPIHKAEQSAATRLQVFLDFPPAGSEALDEDIDAVERESGIVYGELQRLAIRTAAEKGMLILTGGPGTGKTTAIRGILHLFKRQGLNVALAAPTGRAAKRMSELAGQEAKTLHRLLEAQKTEDNRPPVFMRNAKNLLDCSALILDELSMVDAYLFSAVLDALPLSCRLILVGDADQLPAVGAGNTLGDLLRADALPSVRLTKVYRQAMASLIVENAHRIIDDLPPILDDVTRDFFFMPKSTPALVQQTVCELVSQRLPKSYDLDPMTQIQVLCPSKMGLAGTGQMNAALQNVLNPPSDDKKEHTHAGRSFRTGDKVMQMKNDYELPWRDEWDKEGNGIMNGELGIVREIHPKEQSFIVDFGGLTTIYPFKKLENLDLAYAVTVHKSQGSEFEAVVLPVRSVPWPLSYRALLYTGVTRAKRLFVGVGSAEEFQKMAANVRTGVRYSGLANFLNHSQST